MSILDADARTKAENWTLATNSRAAFERFPVGSEWMYLSGSAGAPAHVRVLRVGEQRPVRVKVEFLEDTFEGQRDWVSTATLHVPWSERAEYLATEERWGRVLAPSPSKSLVQTVCGSIIEPHVHERVLEIIEGDRTGAAIVHDVRALSKKTGINTDELVDPLGWQLPTGSSVVSWNTIALVARSIARQHNGAIALELARASAESLAEHRAAIRSRVPVSHETPAHRGLEATSRSHDELIVTLGEWIGQDLRRPTDRYIEVFDQLQQARALLARALPDLIPLSQRAHTRELVEEITEFNGRLT